MTSKRPKQKSTRKDDPHLHAKSQMEQSRKTMLHRPAARIGEMQHGRQH
jgi:hypothetical protein